MGFPCQDISGAGQGVGVHGSRSTLIFDALSLVSQLPSVEWILMENSSFIVHRGLEDVRKKLNALGFRLEYLILSAADLGARHQRRRWFGLAWRSRSAPTIFPMPPRLFDWGREPVPRMLRVQNAKSRAKERARCERLGNAVVPVCVQIALHVLSARSRGIMVPSRKPDRRKLRLQFADGKGNVFLKDLWSTPISSPRSWYVSNLHERSARVLVTQLFYEQHTNLNHREVEVIANPNWVEWLQGFPQDWTRVVIAGEYESSQMSC